MKSLPLVTFKTARLLKKVGFPQEGASHTHTTKKGNSYAVPSQEEALQWLRDSRRLWVEVLKDRRSFRYRSLIWQYGDNYPKNQDTLVGFTMFRLTYEEVVEKSIIKACNHFIKLLCK